MIRPSVVTSDLPQALRPAIGARVINVVGIGVALAALTARLTHMSTDVSSPPIHMLFVTSVPTFVAGASAAAFLRFRNAASANHSTLLLGSVAAMAAASSWCLFVLFAIPNLYLPIFVAAVVAMIWAHRYRTKDRVSADEPCESLVGVTVLIIAGVAMLFMLLSEDRCSRMDWGVVCQPHGRPSRGLYSPDAWLAEERISVFALFTLSAVGIFCGTAGWRLARSRSVARRAFLDLVEAGAIDGYRVRPAGPHRTLVRVTHGAGYRVGTIETPILDYVSDLSHHPRRYFFVRIGYALKLARPQDMDYRFEKVRGLSRSS